MASGLEPRSVETHNWGSFCYASLPLVFFLQPLPGLRNNEALQLPPRECLPHIFPIYSALPILQGPGKILHLQEADVRPPSPQGSKKAY